MTGTVYTCLHTKQSRSYWNHLVIRSNEMQQYAGVYLLQNYSTDTWYDLYQKLQLHFDVLLMMGAIETRNI